VEASLPFYDDFNRQNNPYISGYWRERIGNFIISNNSAVGVDPSISLMTLNGIREKDSFISCYVDLINSSIPTGAARSYMPVGSGGGIITRYTADPYGVFGDGYMYLGMIAKNGTTYYGQIWSNNGSWSLLSSSPINSTNTVGVLAFKTLGSSLTLYFNNTQIVSAINTSIPGYGGIGIRALGANCIFDNMQVSSISNYNRSRDIDQNYINWGLLRMINQNNISGWGE